MVYALQEDIIIEVVGVELLYRACISAPNQVINEVGHFSCQKAASKLLNYLLSMDQHSAIPMLLVLAVSSRLCMYCNNFLKTLTFDLISVGVTKFIQKLLCTKKSRQSALPPLAKGVSLLSWTTQLLLFGSNENWVHNIVSMAYIFCSVVLIIN